MKTALITGAGGFIGNAMVDRLKSEGYWVRGIDLKYPEFSATQADEFIIGDLRSKTTIEINGLINSDHFSTPKYFDEVYQFAADMGGCQFIFTGDHDADLMSNSAMINLNVCEFFKSSGSKIFYSSSACIYPQEIQAFSESQGLKESYAYPANPDSEYGWEKLFSERLYLAYARNYKLNVCIARFHNIYGPKGTYVGGREKAPASICRKVVESNGKVDIWGDGLQTRSFLYIDDCIDAVLLLMESDFKEPINIGSEEMVSINQLWELAIIISGKRIQINHIERPPNTLGVQGRNSDNTLIRKVLNWEPKFTLIDGIGLLYKWIEKQHDL